MGSNMKTSDVIILGAGISGLSVAYHLSTLGINSIQVLGERSGQSFQIPGYAVGGQLDNFTRFSHAYGTDFATAMWRFANDGLQNLKVFCNDNKIAYHQGDFMRIAATPAEMTELKKAVEQMSAAGLNPKLRVDASEWSKQVLGVQIEASNAICLQPNALLENLQNRKVQHDATTAVRFDKVDGKIAVKAKNGKSYQAEFLVLANHLSASTLLPGLREVLISYADQWFEVELQQVKGLEHIPVGSYFSAQHGYYWGVRSAPNKMCLGGARFLRQYAGIGASESRFVSKAEIATIEKFKSLIASNGFDVIKVDRRTGLLGCRPCDELPLIGPLPSADRVLISTGFMGSGITWAFQGARVIAELIANGQSTMMPRQLWPERLRSLNG